MSTAFHGLPTRALSSPALHLEYLAAAGPRIVHLSLPDGENLLVECPDLTIPTPLGEFHLYGGHRLWHAPEAMPRSYVPDDGPLDITQDATGGVRLLQPIEGLTGIRKGIAIRLASDRAAVTLTHTLENCGPWAVELACWALTQMRLGGLAVLPQTGHALDSAGLLPNRNLVLWPYSRLADARLSLCDDFVLIDARPQLPPIKVGYMNRHGWLGYLTGEVFFVKRFTVAPDQPHVDFGCNAESYCNDRFIEIESVGPLVRLEPGETATHVEEWTLHRADGVEQTPEGIRELVTRLGLPTG